MLRACKTGASTKRVLQQLPKYKAVELLKLYIFEQIKILTTTEDSTEADFFIGYAANF